MSMYKKIKGITSGGMPMEAPEKPTIDFSAGRNNTSDQKQEISNAYSSAPSQTRAPAYTPPKKEGGKGDWQQSQESKTAESLVKQNMRTAWGSGTGRVSNRQAGGIQANHEQALKLVRQAAQKRKWG